MRKVFIGLAVAAAVASSSVLANDNAGGPDAGKDASGNPVSASTVGITTLVVATTAAIASNGNGKSPARGTINLPPIVTPVDPPVATCDGGDALVDGVCIGSTITTTVTGTGTATSTITVPVTFTYAPVN